MLQRFKIYFIIATILALIVLVLAIAVAMQSDQPSTSPLFPTPTPISIEMTRKNAPKTIQTAPTFPPSQGAGIDTTSTTIQESIFEIEKVYPLLPYAKTVTLSTGQEVAIVIPSQDVQHNPWTLTVQIFDIDYNVATTDPNYTVSRNAFREAAATVFSWLLSQNIDPKKIYINWGDKSYIQDNAEAWLR